MPARPSNISGIELLNVLNQNIREIQIRVDSLHKQIPQHRLITSSGSLNFGAIPANEAVERNVRVPGATQVGSASASPQLDLGNPHLIWSAKIASNGIVTVRLLNPTGSPVTPNTVTWNASVVQ